MQTLRRDFLKQAGAVTALGLATQSRAQSRPKLVIGVQTIELRESVLASRVLDGAPFEVEWALLPGPAAQLSALYAKSIDLGLGGSTSLIFEQAKAENWNAASPPLQIVATWENPDQKQYPAIVTAVRKSAGIQTLAELRGKRWANNYGGFNYGQYIATLVQAKLTEKDIQGARFVDQYASGTAFNRGQVDVYSGGPLGIFDALKSGEGRILVNNTDTRVPGSTIFIARQEVLQDAGRSAVLGEFLARVGRHWTWYGQNLGQVEETYVKKLQQPLERAQYAARFGHSRFRAVDATLQAELQGLADLFFEFKVIARKIDVASELNPRFNAQIGAVAT